MNRLEAQHLLFAPAPARLQLQRLEIPKAASRAYTVNVWRNHAIEPVLSLVGPYLAYGGWNATFTLGAYDDTLSFTGHNAADLELVWLDSSRYAMPNWTEWLQGRLLALRGMSKAPIVVATWLQSGDDLNAMQTFVDAQAATYWADLEAISNDAAVPLVDARTAALAGTPIASGVHALIARTLAGRWLPAALLPPIKAVAVDLDNTLHSGVLGEDGTEGILVEEGHLALHKLLRALRERGIFLALVSRNERVDVEALFATRPDYGLHLDDFSVVEVSWSDKAGALVRAASSLRIGLDAMLFVDDNPGELLAVATQLPEVHTLLAQANAKDTCRAIEHYPGLWRWKASDADARRIRDLAATAQRDKLLTESGNPAAYFESLGVTLTYRHDPVEQLRRLADLCAKTNQFNLALRRYNESEVADMLPRADCDVASVQLSDKLADSGVIAAIIAHRHDRQLVVEELCISCRALGRQLEDTIVLHAIRTMPNFAGCDEVAFRVRHGPRNQPALDWLARFLAAPAPLEPGLHAVAAQRLRTFAPHPSLSIAGLQTP